MTLFRHNWFFGLRSKNTFCDGFGQSWLDDIRFLLRFRRCRSTPVTWRSPNANETSQWNDHPVIGRFGDMYAVANVENERWIVRDRMWYGWPGPPRFVFFSLADDHIQIAVDFNEWPKVWTEPTEDQSDPMRPLVM